jgi:putative ABC transport system ATP-binding protein
MAQYQGDGAPVIAVQRLAKAYRMGRQAVPALRDVNLEIQPGEFVAIMGPSGSGKSTFLNLIGLLDRPTRGEYLLDGLPVAKMSKNQLATIRNQKLGFVFQGFNLLAQATATDNVALPLLYAGNSKEARQRAQAMLRKVGLGNRLDHKPAELSGGQQQRVAIARALINRPSLLLADEPTGNLDSHTSVEIMALLQALNAGGITIMMVTHEADIAAYAQRHIAFRDGVVVNDTRNVAPLRALPAPKREEVTA